MNDKYNEILAVLKSGFEIFIYIAALFGVLLSIFVYSGVLTFTQQIETSHIYIDNCNMSDMDKLIYELNSDGWVLYYSENCYYCDKQKDILGNSYDYINKVNGDKYYIPEWLEGYPCWYNYKINQHIYGLQNKSNLNTMNIMMD